MPLKSRLFFGFRAKVTLVAVLALVFVMGLSNYVIYRFTLDTQFEQMRQQLIVIAQTASLQVDADMLQRIPPGREAVETSEYKTVANRLKRIRDMNPSIKYIYTLKKTNTPGTWNFIVDLDPELERRGGREITAYPGDPYDVSRFPEMMNAYGGPSSDRTLLEDEWGVTLSGYAPLRNRLGIVVAVLGVDMDASEVYRAQRAVNRAIVIVFLVGVLLSIVMAMIVSRHVTARIDKLIEGTRALSSGKLDYRLEVKGKDEIAELSQSFNTMAGSLQESRKKLEEYFFGIIQTLVRMLEQKDKYTQGHSERVGVYAEKLGRKLGLPKGECDLLRKAGELHDIGKLAVHEHILMKAGPLTTEEWEMIRRHPVIGAEALKPVHFGDIIMTSIYCHHERFDGTGYPQKLRGNQISVHAHIMSVADAYDAMTTTRPYRKAIERKAAIEEIRIHAGSQFHPDIAAAFIELLEEEAEKGD